MKIRLEERTHTEYIHDLNTDLPIIT